MQITADEIKVRVINIQQQYSDAIDDDTIYMNQVHTDVNEYMTKKLTYDDYKELRTGTIQFMLRYGNPNNTTEGSYYSYISGSVREAIVFDIIWTQPRRKEFESACMFYGSCPKLDSILLNLCHQLARLAMPIPASVM